MIQDEENIPGAGKETLFIKTFFPQNTFAMIR